MKKGVMKKLAVGLLAAIAITALPVQDLSATEVAEETTVTEGNAAATEEAATTEENAAVEGENLQQEKPEQKLNYIYVEKPYLETPDEQNLVFSWGDGSEEITEASVSYRIGDSEVREWESSVISDGLLLFNEEFSNETDTGIYEIVSLKLTVDGTEAEYSLEEMDTSAMFGVNEEYEGYGEDAVQMASEEGVIPLVEASVVTIDENGNTSGEETIEAALEQAETETAAAGISTFALDAGNRSRAVERSGNLVVAIDAGHDNLDAGASANGKREEVLTLKIANYCKEELEKYAGVTVFMTRTGSECPVGVTAYPHAGECIDKRVKKAADAGADVIVSIHLNSAVSSAAYGAEVIVPNKNWKPEQNQQGEAMANLILEQLTSLGLYNRGFYYKNTTINERYEDGSLSDYFTLHNSGKEYGVTAMIVEHAFLSASAGSVDQSLLSSEEGLKKLGIADATGIAKYYGLKKAGERVSVPEGTYVLESALKSGSAVSIKNSGKENLAGAVLNDYQNLSSQRFEISSNGNGYYTITAEHSGKVLDVKNGSSEAGTAVQQYESNNSLAQSWAFVYAGDGLYYITSGLGTYLDVSGAATANGTMIDSYSYTGTTAQKWRLVESDYRPIENGTYTFENAKSSGKVLDVGSASTANGAKVNTYIGNNTSAQRFEVYYVQGGYYHIVAEHSGKALDVPGGSRKEGTALQQWERNSNDAQLWKFVDTGNGTYYFKSKCGTVIGMTDSGGVTMQNMQDVKNCQWKVKTSDYQPVKNADYVISSKKSEIQTVSGKNGNIQLETFDNLDRQKFKVAYQGKGYYKIESKETGNSLDVASGLDIAGTNVQEYAWNASDAQLWKFVSADDGSYYIKSKLGTVLDLPSGSTSSGTNIQTYTMNYTDAQRWILDTSKATVSEKPIENGIYTIQNLTGSNQVLDIAAAMVTDYGNVQLYTGNDTSAQRYEITYVKDGYYKIIAEHSGKALDVLAASNQAGANVQQYTWNGSDAQLWKFIKGTDDTYYIKSKLGTVLDINKSSAVSGANVQMNLVTGTKTQQWKMKKAEDKLVEDGTYTFRVSASTRYVLDISSASTGNGANAQIYSYNGTGAQQFQVTYIRDGYYSIIAKHSGKALEHKTSASLNGANVQQGEWKEKDNQLWKFIKKEENLYYIRSKAGAVLDINAGVISDASNVQLYQINGTNAQQWSLEKAVTLEEVKMDAGIYIIRSALDNTNVLDIAAASTANGANAQVYTDNGSDAQRFRIQVADDGYYKILSEASGKALDIANGSTDDGANVQQYQWNSSNAQQWRFIDAGNGTFYIQSKLGTVLDVQWGIAVSGTNVQAYTLNQSKAQKWVVEKIDEDLYPIMGTSTVTVDQMVKFFEDKDGKYPYTEEDGVKDIRAFCQIYLEECKAEGVKAEVAFAQAMMETGFLKFSGDVKKEQYNFAGLGATGNGEPGNSFKDIRTGIRAQVQHLKAYASTAPLNQECVDVRFAYVTRGMAKYVEWLGINENPNNTSDKKYGWAMQKNYGYNIVNLYIMPMLES